METHLTLRPGMPGTKKLVARFGERLVRVRYLYDPATRRRLKTVELVIEAVEWEPRRRRPRRRTLDLIGVRIDYNERDLRGAVKTAGGIWRPRQRLCELSCGPRSGSGSPRRRPSPHRLSKLSTGISRHTAADLSLCP